MDRTFVGLGAILGCLGVGLGAFAAHGLKQRLPIEMLIVFETGVRYHMYHALALVAVGLAWSRWPVAPLALAGWLFVAGVAIFSGSLYALATSGVRVLGAITPIGGLAFLAGWIAFAYGVLSSGR